MRVLVTGAGGRLGRSVVDALVAGGFEVIACDRSVTEDARVTVEPIDLADAAATAELFERVRPDAVVHLAAISVPFSAPERDILMTNTGLTASVVDAAVAAGVSRVLVSSSPTILGYNAPLGWSPDYLPLDERHPVRPWNGYALSKLVMEEIVATAVRVAGPGIRFGVFRPCYVVSAEEWAGAPTQQGHTIVERLRDPALAAVSLFNYVDARDAADFVIAWLTSESVPNGETFFVGAADALATRPVSELWESFCPQLGPDAAALTGTRPVFSIAKAEHLLGWTPRRSWRTELPADVVTELSGQEPAEGTR